MKRILPFLLVFGGLFFSEAQTPVNCYRLYLHDKVGSPYTLDNPNEFLSPRALDKRVRFDIPVTEEDLPVTPAYVQAILQTDDSVLVLSTSRWFNTVVIRCPHATALNSIRDLVFVDSIIPVGHLTDLSVQSEEPEIILNGAVYSPTTDSLQYGDGLAQIAIHNGHLLHNEGFRGDGMLITMLDGGWLAFNRNEYFANLYENGQILGTYNFIPGQDDVYWGTSHGASCASIILANVNAETDNGYFSFVGTAPNASMIFIRTEYNEKEQPMEEDFWIAGAEIADSVGSDVLTSSLGYFHFDDLNEGIDQNGLDGHSRLISRAATIAAHKGIIVCQAAGNEGNKDWHKISRPADAEDILAVGATSVDSVPAAFTGVGPSADGRVKPDVASVGKGTYQFSTFSLPVIDTTTQEATSIIHCELRPGNGTSFATPCLAGLAACLWQALPQYSSLEIMQIIREAGHLYHAPDTLMGYGIPDFYRAYLENREVGIQENQLLHGLNVYPNPCQDRCTILNTSSEKKEVMVLDLSGKVVLDQILAPESEAIVNTGAWADGLYLLIAKGKNGLSEALKIVKH